MENLSTVQLSQLTELTWQISALEDLGGLVDYFKKFNQLVAYDALALFYSVLRPRLQIFLIHAENILASSLESEPNFAVHPRMRINMVLNNSSAVDFHLWRDQKKKKFSRRERQLFKLLSLPLNATLSRLYADGDLQTKKELLEHALELHPAARIMVDSSGKILQLTRLARDIWENLSAHEQAIMANEIIEAKPEREKIIFLSGAHAWLIKKIEIPVGDNFNHLHLAELTETDETAARYFALANKLTKRQIEMLNLALLGLSNQQIAQRMRVTTNTVKAHLKASYRCLGIKRRVEIPSEIKKLSK